MNSHVYFTVAPTDKVSGPYASLAAFENANKNLLAYRPDYTKVLML